MIVSQQDVKEAVLQAIDEAQLSKVTSRQIIDKVCSDLSLDREKWKDQIKKETYEYLQSKDLDLSSQDLGNSNDAGHNQNKRQSGKRVRDNSDRNDNSDQKDGDEENKQSIHSLQPVKKQKPSNTLEVAKDGCVLELGSGKRVTLSEFKRTWYLGLREYYQRDGEWKPGKKGISLKLSEAEQLIEKLPDIKEAVGKQKEGQVADLGSNRFVNISRFKGQIYVNIREMYQDSNGSLKPSAKGLALNKEQWGVLHKNGDKLKDIVDRIT